MCFWFLFLSFLFIILDSLKKIDFLGTQALAVSWSTSPVHDLHSFVNASRLVGECLSDEKRSRWGRLGFDVVVVFFFF